MKLRIGSLRLTWAWFWTGLAAALLGGSALLLTALALSGRDRGDVVLAVLLIGFPAVLVSFALGTIALVSSRPKGGTAKVLRRSAIALLAAVALIAGLVTIGTSGASTGSIGVTLAGLALAAIVWLDLRGEEGLGG